MARASKESEGYSWTNRSIGGSNGRHGRPAGACCIRGVGVRDEGISRARERQNPGCAPRAWGRALVRRGASTWASLGLSITGIITLLLVPACFRAGLEATVWSPPVRRSGWRRGGAGLRLHPRISEEVSFFISQKPNYCCHDEQKKV